jgi:hypothetical protein
LLVLLVSCVWLDDVFADLSDVVVLCKGFKVVKLTLRGCWIGAGGAWLGAGGCWLGAGGAVDWGCIKAPIFCVCTWFAVSFATTEAPGCSVVKLTLRGCVVKGTVAMATGVVVLEGELVKGIELRVCC